MKVEWTYTKGAIEAEEVRDNLTEEEAENLMHDLMFDFDVEAAWHLDDDDDMIYCFSRM